ncbi:hypothetical protein IQ07DRAFT_313514 [Pyrenochaeta sp. DS3sAY3a]|nr:hypothetical protein IQ07DRAFT_313514 [Pyrenochaeta sp. DS3sAY3a]
MATETHTRPNASNATPGLIGVVFLLAIAFSTYIIRMVTRIRPVFKLTASDYIVTAALACELVSLSLLLGTIDLGVSGYDEYISPATRITIGKLFFGLGLSAFWASSLARISIGCMLLRFPISKAWRTTLWILLALQVVMPIGANIFALLQCRPIRALWEPVPNAVCWSAGVSQSYGYIYASFGTISDLIFAGMPIHLFWSLNRPLLERMLGIVLMGFGIIAAIAGAMKIHHISAWNPRRAEFRDWIPLLWWYRVEEIGLIIAACAPFLKPLMERALKGLGASPFGFRTIRLRTVDEEGVGKENSAGKSNSSSVTPCGSRKPGCTCTETNVSEPNTEGSKHQDQ